MSTIEYQIQQFKLSNFGKEFYVKPRVQSMMNGDGQFCWE